MSEHEWKFGEWGSCDNDIRRVRWVSRVGKNNYFLRLDGHVQAYDLHRIEHLPDCDSWDWQPTPKLQLREGAWYERADGKVVGPCSAGLETIPKWKFQVASVFYDEVGNQVNGNPILALIREVPAPAPKYRPFANAAEFKPHRDRWLKHKQSDVGKILLCVAYSSEGVTACVSFMTYAAALDSMVFDDGSPFGVEVTE